MKRIAMEERYKTDDEKDVTLGCAFCKKELSKEPLRFGMFHENKFLLGVLFTCSEECAKTITDRTYALKLF